jgi:hypothetical protein
VIRHFLVIHRISEDMRTRYDRFRLCYISRKIQKVKHSIDVACLVLFNAQTMILILCCLMCDKGTNKICYKNNVSAMYDTIAYEIPMEEKNRKTKAKIRIKLKVQKWVCTRGCKPRHVCFLCYITERLQR